MDSRLQPLPALAFAALVASSLACGVGYKPAMSAEQLAASRHPGTALVAYLQQTSADPAVCDTHRRDGPAIEYVTGAVVHKLGKAFVDGEITPARWKACSLRLWSSADDALAGELASELLDQLSNHALASDLGADRHVRERLRAVLDLTVQRTATSALPLDRARSIAKKARERLATVEPEARELLADVVKRLDLEGGLEDGVPVDSARIAATDDEARLATWATRLPSEPLRTQAGERLLALRVSVLPASWRESAATAVRDHGFFAVPADAAVVNARWEPRSDDTVMLRVLQNPARGVVRLLPAARDGTRSGDPTVDLHGPLRISVHGLDAPITVCPGEDRWDPTPCMPADRLHLTHAIAALTPTGRIVFPDELALDDVLRLGSDGDRLAAQLLVDDVVIDVDLPIEFDSVPGHRVAGRFTLKVDVWELSHERLLIEYDALLRTNRQVVPESDTSFVLRAAIDKNGNAASIAARIRCTNCDDVRKALDHMLISDGGSVDVREVKD